jgi:hypothetical protein
MEVLRDIGLFVCALLFVVLSASVGHASFSYRVFSPSPPAISQYSTIAFVVPKIDRQSTAALSCEAPELYSALLEQNILFGNSP